MQRLEVSCTVRHIYTYVFRCQSVIGVDRKTEPKTHCYGIRKKHLNALRIIGYQAFMVINY